MDVQQMIACPVCTLYLREGMSMHSHLDTHPKDQVIEALVRVYSSERLPGSFSQSPQSPIMGSFLPIVSEEHIVIGRQQVTGVIHQPLMPYPVYHPQQQFIQTNHFMPEEADCGNKSTILSLESNDIGTNTNVINLSQVDNYSENVENLTVVNTNHDVISNENEEPSNFKQQEIYYMTGVQHTPRSPESHHSCVSARSNLTPERSQGVHPCDDEYIISDCHYQDEAARHGSDTPNNCEEESKTREKDGECKEESLQAYERMPAHGELSTNSITSDWIDEEDMEEPTITGPIWDLRRDSSEVKSAPEVYPCLYCQEELKSPSERRMHIATVHSSSTVHSTPTVHSTATDLPDSKKKLDSCKMCTKCDAQFLSVKELREHRKNEHPKMLRKCNVCQETFVNKAKFTEHLVNIHPLECKICGKTFHSTSGMNLHSKIHLKVKPHLCHLCPKSFITPHKLREHVNGHMNIAPIQCDLCPRKFKRYSNLKQHKDLAHFKVKKKVKDYFCDCGESFLSKKKLARHQETHLMKPKQCPYCPEKFIHSTSLTRHIRRNHDSQYLPKYSSSKARNVQCPICNLTCLETSLSTHIKQHSNNKPFSCIICSKKFHTKWNLNLHKWTHTSRISKPFKCNLCKGAFIRFGDFQAHIRSHLGHKPFTCNHCGLQFIRKQNWQRHEREHTGIKDFTCTECGKSFYRSYYLTEHLRVHSGLKPYTCHICNKMSSTKSNHNKHLKTHHARETINTEG